MSDNIKKIGFNIIKDNIANDGLEDNFFLFDNFSGKTNVPELMLVTDYPIRLNTITIIAFCMDGYIKFDLGLKKITLSKNQLCIILPDQIIRTTEISSDFKSGFMVVKRDFFNSQNHFLETINLHNNLIEQSYFDLSQKEMQEYIKIFNNIKEKIADKNNIYRLQIVQNYFQITFYNLYNLIIRHKNTEKDAIRNNNTLIYEKFIKLVETHYRNEHNVNFYADKICLSPKYLSAIIYEISGKHASDWIHEYIMLEAKALLKSTNMSLKNISDLLCFCTPSHFGRFFRRYSGYTPSEYKKR